jgi:hypothetical protein
MKFKALLPLMMISGIATAGDYQYEFNGTYTDTEYKTDFGNGSTDTLELSGKYYFDTVNLTGPWAESAFLDHASYAELSYADLDDGDTQWGLGGSLYLDKFVLGLNLDYMDGDGFSASSQTAELGYLVKDNWKLSANLVRSEGETGWYLTSKSVMELADNQWFAFDAAFTNDDTLTEASYLVDLSGTYYLNEQLGVGAGYIKEGNEYDAYELHASYFLNQNVSVKLAYSDADIGNEFFNASVEGFSLSLNGRF